jgi:hypothetical protein
LLTKKGIVPPEASRTSAHVGRVGQQSSFDDF